jgi:translation initiation factor IF-2
MSEASVRSLREEVEALSRPERSRLRAVDSPADALEAADLGVAPAPGRRFQRQAPATAEHGGSDASVALPADRRTRAAGVARPADPPEFTAPLERSAPPGPPHPRSRIRPDLDPPTATRLPARPGHDPGAPAPAAAPAGLGASVPDPSGARAGFHAPAAAPTSTPRPTVRITGQAARRPPRPRPSASARRSRPDRLALWAVALGLFMAFMAAVTAEAAAADPPATGPAVLSIR